MKRFLAMATVLLGLVGSGCLKGGAGGAGGAGGTTGDDGTPRACVDDALRPCVGNFTVPHVDARATLAALREFTEAYPYRQSGGATHLAAREDLADRFAAAGLEVVRQSFPSGRGPLDYDGENIVGIKWGADRERWIIVGAHYDITEGAVHGAYDDGSGTAMVFQLAAAFANVNTTRTLVFAEFDQEELEMVGSRAFVGAVDQERFAYNATLDGMVNLDMIGITWPHPAKMVVWENSRDLRAEIQRLANETGIPAGQLEFRRSKTGLSDSVAFMEAGITTAFFFSDWDEYILPNGAPTPFVGLYAGAYPWWHKVDTYDTMVLAAGDEDTLRAGFQTTLDVVSPLVAFMASDAFVGEPDE